MSFGSVRIVALARCTTEVSLEGLDGNLHMRIEQCFGADYGEEARQHLKAGADSPRLPSPDLPLLPRLFSTKGEVCTRIQTPVPIDYVQVPVSRVQRCTPDEVVRHLGQVLHFKAYLRDRRRLSCQELTRRHA